MGIDKFINDYFDGNLQPEEDKEFRELLENDLNAREEFDLMLSIHSILKEDAESIAVPKNLEQKVEERILANYLRMVSANSRANSRRIAYSLVAILVLFAFAIYNIDDGRVVFNNSYFLSEVLKQQELLQSQVPTIEENLGLLAINTSPNKKSILPPRRIEKDLSNNLTTLEISSKQIEKEQVLLISKSRVDQSLALEVNFEKEGKILSSQNVKSNRLFSGYSSSVNSGSFYNGKNSNLVNFVNEIHTKGIALTGFSSFPLKKFGIDGKNVKSFSSFSQSIGYKVADNLRLGLEFGYFDYSYKKMTTILVPAIAVPAKERKIADKKIADKNYDAKILTNGEDNNFPSYVQVQVPIDRNYQHYWGSVFVDYEVPIARYLSVVSRLNVGATSDGFLGGVVVFSEFQPINGVTFNFGIENKSYWSSLPSDKYSLKSILGIVYGLSIKLNLEN